MRREHRYIVAKLQDVGKYLSESECVTLDHILYKITEGRCRDGRRILNCVVVEDDWPEFEPTWAAIAARVDREGETA